MQPKYTQSANIDPAKATFGEKSAGVLALQQSLNKSNAGVAGYTPLKEDGMYGPLTQSATQFKAPVVTTTPATGSNPNNASGSSTAARSNITAIGNDISGLESTSQANRKLLLDRLGINEANLKQDISGIMRDYEQASRIQEKRQEKDYAGTSTKLVTSGGGFLGYTGSQEGVLQNLKGTFEEEKGALMSKRDNAIQAARSAYNDKQFQLASALVKEARDTENEIYSRQKDFAEQSLALARENRAQTEFDAGLADKKIKSYAMMDDATFARQNPLDIAALDDIYYPGYTANARLIEKKALDVKTKKDAIDLDKDILSARLQMPAGQKFTLGGQTYTGLKSSSGSDGGTESERNAIIRSKIGTLFSPGYTVPGSKGIPFIDNNGLPTVEGWKEAIKISNMERKEFITQFGYLLQPAVEAGIIDRFGLTRPERELIEGKL